MAVVLRIWAFNPLKGNIGHASLEVGQGSSGRYMSVWPSGRFDNKGMKVSKKFDFEQEDGEAWYQDTFLSLDEQKMIRYWDRLSSTNSLTYSNFMYGFNCMTNAAVFLTCGMGLDPIEDWHMFATVHEHWSLMWFANGMKLKGW